MNLQEWRDIAEDISTETSEEYWKLSVGLPYDEKKIAMLEKKGAEHARIFLSNWKEPKDIYESCVGSLVSEKVFKFGLQITEIRKSKIVSSKHKFKGKYVSWQTWRQFASSADDKQRKEVFDEFIKLTSEISPVIKQLFETATKMFAEYKLDPLDMYLDDHKMSYDALKHFVEKLRDAVKKPFQREYKRYCKELFGRAPEYYDDFYTLRNKLFENIKLPKTDAIAKILETAKNLGFDVSKIKLDKEDRPDKYASPFCSSIRVPTDVRVSFKPENPVNDLSSVYHEYGHALHGVSIDPKLPYEIRCMLSEGCCETFSTLFELMVHDPYFLEKHLGYPRVLAEDLVKRLNFSWLYAAAFYCANSLFRLEYWHAKIPHEKCSALYAKYIKACTGIDLPGEYWMLHHILPESLMYVPSYLLAESRSAEITAKLRADFGKTWWENKGAGIYIKNLMKPGADSPVGDFGKITPEFLVNAMIKE